MAEKERANAKSHDKEEKKHGHKTHKETHKRNESGSNLTKYLIAFIAIASIFVVYNQFQIMSAYEELSQKGIIKNVYSASSSSSVSLKAVNLEEIKSTAHSIKMLFPVDEIKNDQDAINMMIPTGTPEYGEELGISYDRPAESLNFMAKTLWPQMRKLKTEKPDVWERYLNLASKPVGISCEFCCGLKAVGIRPDGEPMCGCQHNPALLALTLWLMDNRPDMSDAEILKEVLKWKALFYPKNMVQLAIEVSGKDASQLDVMPSMVGGC